MFRVLVEALPEPNLHWMAYIGVDMCVAMCVGIAQYHGSALDLIAPARQL